MKIVKHVAKVLFVAYAAFMIIRPLTIPRLPPVQFISSAETTQLS